MKTIVTLLLAILLLTLAACEQAAVPSAAASSGPNHTLGDTGIRVGGSVESGGTVSR